MKLARLIHDTRPQPPADLGAIDDFAPDTHGLGAWARRTFIGAGGALENARHEPLQDATIGWLWTTFDAQDRNRRILGECKLIRPPQKRWGSAMGAHQLREWFGEDLDFLITIDANAAAEMDDWSFCALIEHELCHAAQDVDDEGEPRFTRDGEPIFRIIGHDVEEFVDVVARYGADATGTRAMVKAANAGPSIGAAAIAAACGTCRAMRRA